MIAWAGPDELAREVAALGSLSIAHVSGRVAGRARPR